MTLYKYDRVFLGNKANELGFNRDTLEKVTRLYDILRFMNNHPLESLIDKYLTEKDIVRGTFEFYNTVLKQYVTYYIFRSNLLQPEFDLFGVPVTAQMLFAFSSYFQNPPKIFLGFICELAGSFKLNSLF